MFTSLFRAVNMVLALQTLERVGELCMAATSGDAFAMKRVLSSGFGARVDEDDEVSACFAVHRCW